MASKLDKIAHLTKGLATLPDPPKAEKARPKPGVPITLRLPEDLLARYAAEAGRRSGQIGRTVTAQTVMLEILAAGLPANG